MQRTSWVKVVACGAVLLFGAAVLAEEQPAQTPPWKKAYTGADATGDQVIGLWQFAPGKEMSDSSGHQHDLTLQGTARVAEGGISGKCLECFPTDSRKDEPGGAYAKNDPSLSPPGAFTIELWIKPKPEFEKLAVAFLVDKKYLHYAKEGADFNRDYCLWVRGGEHFGRQLVAVLGYEKDSEVYGSDDVHLESGQWHHIAFTYDGAGTGCWFQDGIPVGRVTHQGRGPVSPGPYNLYIGDRAGSSFGAFPGYIAQVRICKGIVPAFDPNAKPSPTADKPAP